MPKYKEPDFDIKYEAKCKKYFVVNKENNQNVFSAWNIGLCEDYIEDKLNDYFEAIEWDRIADNYRNKGLGNIY